MKTLIDFNGSMVLGKKEARVTIMVGDEPGIIVTRGVFVGIAKGNFWRKLRQAWIAIKFIFGKGYYVDRTV